MTPCEKLQALRHLIKQKGGWGILVPRQDRYQGEYVAPCDERLLWLTGFTGSAGYALVTLKKAALCVDGRYSLQATQQVEESLFDFLPMGGDRTLTWLKEQTKENSASTRCVLFYDPWLHTPSQLKTWEKMCASAEIELSPLDENFIDLLWQDQPARPKGFVSFHPLKYAGVSTVHKREAIIHAMHMEKAQALVLTSPESICWLYNIRGEDLAFVPTPDMMAIVDEEGKSRWFIEPSKVPLAVQESFDFPVEICSFHEINRALGSLGNEKVWVDPDQIPLALYDLIPSKNRILKQDPCVLARALKNDIEQSGARQAHIKDGVAVVRFLAWLEGCSLEEKVTFHELYLADRLEGFRRDNEGFRGLSFPTIAGAAEHGAIVHYKATAETSKNLKANSLFLLDSGAHYNEGTTDITRTLAVGEPAYEHKDRFTRVLKGHIALAAAVFPAGTTGQQLDALARLPLWQQGLDYDHGTGHGVGSFLNVHEGPQRISKSPVGSALYPGMILSNEPGYYKPHNYGIRIENLVLVCVCEEEKFKERKMMFFETLTLVPLDRSLIEKSLLSHEEIAWVNIYHQRVYHTLAPFLQEQDLKALEWLKKATVTL